MPLVPMAELLANARRNGYAVCYCESWNLESLQAVLEAAEELGSPVAVGFNGGFLRHPARCRPENLAYYAGLGLAVRQASVPVSFLLNETEDLGQIEQGIDLGFNAVMVESHNLGLEEYCQLVKKVVALAHNRDVFVEAQVGRLPEGNNQGGQMTDPGLAQRFVEETQIDALAVSIGNVHVLTRGSAAVHFDVLRKIRSRVRVPLVVHGGSGFPPESAGEAIRFGVAKFNFGTVLKQTYLAALSDRLAAYGEPMNPHLFLGMGGEQDIMVAARNAVKLKVRELINVYGFAGNPRPVV